LKFLALDCEPILVFYFLESERSGDQRSEAKLICFLEFGIFMRVVIQKVSEASVSVEKKVVTKIGAGLLVLVGIENNDTNEDIEWLSKKIVQLRIFPDDEGVMNRSVLDEDGEIIVVSQFTLHAMTKKGNRPSYIKASKPEFAIPMYEKFCETLSSDLGKPVGNGVFGAYMDVALVNDGPVTIWIDSKNRE
jgi:D-tyrosyl-tRNA(Tyr) deacylase